MFRSNSAKTASIPASALPLGVVRSRASLTETKPMFLLRYISEAELRQAIQVATNKSERLNEFVQWITFGGDNVIAENEGD
jgi:TnpA family transposase